MQKLKQLYKNLSPAQRLTAFILIALIIIGIVYAVAITIHRIGKVPVTVKFAPYAAKVSLNDTQVKNNATVWLQPGTYRVKTEFNHFESSEYTVEISNDYKYIVGVLTPTDQEGEEYLSNHNQEFIDTEGIVGLALNAEGLLRKKQYPILNYLPMNNQLYSISYAYTDDDEPIITVKSSPEFLDVAVQKLKILKDVDLTTYQINFTLENPFVFYGDNPQINPEETIKQSFSNIKKYEISAGQYIKDDYYAATIYSYNRQEDLQYAHYRVLLQKDDSNYWHIVASPQPLLTQQNTPNTAVDILNSANSLAP